MTLHLAYPFVLYILIPLLCAVAGYVFYSLNKRFFRYPRASSMALHGLGIGKTHKYVLFTLRALLLALLAFLVARPQWADERSKLNVDGIDMVIALDVSGSMQLFDDQNDRRTRIDAAKAEAIRFIDKRTNDPIGLVIFAQDALSRCPITLDKIMLKNMIGSLELGVLDPNATCLGTGLATAVNRLKKSKSKNKVIILLTDGEPTPNEKVSPDLAIQLAQNYGIKVYTVGIGSEQGGFFMHPFFGLQQAGARLNVSLLKKIAESTGGAFFVAKNPQDMRKIYDTIDRLERTQLQTNVYHKYYEAFTYFVWFLLALLGAELLLRMLVWKGAV